MLITQSEWARRNGFSRQYVTQLINNGIVALVDGLVDPEQADLALEAMRSHAKQRRRKGIPDESGSEESGSPLPSMLLRARIKSEVKKASLLEIREKVELGRYVAVEEVQRAAVQSGRLIRDRILRIPDRVAAMLAAETSPRVVREILTTELRQALEALEHDDGIDDR
ncbi:MAG: hypothetical protein HQL58_12535 [Magnetococcales bacterium]|nr:hypothetical protein [Magnetococcales bacterium]